MKVTEVNGKIIIDFESETDNTDKIIAMIKEYEEDQRTLSETQRAMGFVGTAVIHEVRADTAYKLLQKIGRRFK